MSVVAYYRFKAVHSNDTQTIALLCFGDKTYVFSAVGNCRNEVTFLNKEDAHEYYLFKWHHFNQVFSQM